MRIVAVIPARYASTRFPAKVLACDTGKFLIQHTWEQACRASLLDQVIIAADDERIVEAAKGFGADCVLTREDHQSGTDRIAEAVGGLDADIVVNIQADEPEIDPGNIDMVAQLLIDDPGAQMGTLAARFMRTEQVNDPNIVKVIYDDNGRAIYFSRRAIPYHRDSGGVGPLELYRRHLGIYSYRRDFLMKITTVAPTSLELSEKLEQLRALQSGYSIKVATVEHTCDGIDTPEQYAEFVKRYRNQHTDGARAGV